MVVVFETDVWYVACKLLVFAVQKYTSPNIFGSGRWEPSKNEFFDKLSFFRHPEQRISKPETESFFLISE